MSNLNVGDQAPDFQLTDFDGKTVRLSDYAGQKLIVYFYPKALTPGCTVEAADFSNSKDDFSTAGYQIVGISPDTVEQLQKFRDTADLEVRLLADPEKKAINAYGVWGTRKIYGKEVQGIIRTTFVIDVAADGTGTILDIQRNVRAHGHVNRLGKSLGLELKI